MKKENKPISLFNLILWLGGAFYLGWMLRQTIINVLGIELDYEWYDNNYALVQFLTYISFGLVLYKTTKARFITVVYALITVFSFYLISTSADLSAQLDNAWEYVQQNNKEIFDYFTNQVIWLLPILIGYTASELIRILSPRLMEVEFVSKIVAQIVKTVEWVSDFWKDKFQRLTSQTTIVNQKSVVSAGKKKKETVEKNIKKSSTKKDKQSSGKKSKKNHSKKSGSKSKSKKK